jgi:uncharacterized protein
VRATGAVLEFEWDPNKAARNIVKHDVSFDTAMHVFVNPFLFEINDEDDGHKCGTMWSVVDGRLLHVTYTMRGDAYRIISARAAEPYERRKYHEG